MFQCLFCPASSTLEPSKAPMLEVICADDGDDDQHHDVDFMLLPSKKKETNNHEIPDITKSNSTSTEETMNSEDDEEEDEEHERYTRVYDKQDSLNVAMRASTPSSHTLEIFFEEEAQEIETVLSFSSPKSISSSSSSNNSSSATLVSSHSFLGEGPVLLSPSLEIISTNQYEQEKKDQIRWMRIQQELDDILRHVEGVFVEDEAIEALGIAANQVAHLSPGGKNESSSSSFCSSVGQSIVNGSLLEIAEDYYFGDSVSFVVRYAAVLRNTVKQMKMNGLHEIKYYHGQDYEYVRPIMGAADDETMLLDTTISPSTRRQKLVSLAHTVARGSWKSAGWVYQKIAGPSSSSSSSSSSS